MDETERLSHLISDIYDAALDPARWQGVIASIGAFVPGAVVNVFSQDAVTKSVNTHYVHGVAPEFLRSYTEIYVQLNPMFPGTLFFDVDVVINQDDILPRSEFNETRFYREWLLPQGLMDMMGAVLEKSAVSCAVMAVGRKQHDGMIDDGARRRMALIVPHVRRALLIGKVIDLPKVEAAALADTLDGLATSMFLVDETGRIVHANTRGHAMLAEGDVVRAASLRLSSADPQAERPLKDAFAASAGGDAVIGTRGIGIPLQASSGRRHVAHVLPLTAGARRRAGSRYSAAAAVFVQEATMGDATPFETVAAHFRLTPAETRTLFAIVQVGGVPDVAPVLGISETTVRTHLQRIFEKTGTSRQADLVKLVAGYMSPFAGAAE